MSQTDEAWAIAERKTSESTIFTQKFERFTRTRTTAYVRVKLVLKIRLRSYVVSTGMGGDSMQAFSPVENATIGVAAGTIEVTILQPM